MPTNRTAIFWRVLLTQEKDSECMPYFQTACVAGLNKLLSIKKVLLLISCSKTFCLICTVYYNTDGIITFSNRPPSLKQFQFSGNKEYRKSIY